MSTTFPFLLTLCTMPPVARHIVFGLPTFPSHHMQGGFTPPPLPRTLNMLLKSSPDYYYYMPLQRLEAGYYEKDFDAVAYELSHLSLDTEELIMESIAERRTAVLEVAPSGWPHHFQYNAHQPCLDHPVLPIALAAEAFATGENH